MKRVWPGLILLILMLPGGRTARGDDDLWAREWQSTRIASVRVHHEVGEPVPSAWLRDLERAVQRLAGELGLTAAQLASLRHEPIEYLYLPDAMSASWFGVGEVDGMALVGQRRIIATRLAHEHELVHVLAHIAISPAPAYSHPFIQEGLASYLGGHVAESPMAVLALGDEVLDRNRGLIPRILTVSGFRESPLPDEERYAAAARFVHYLDSRGGRARLVALLRLLAGFQEEVFARPASFVEVQLEGIYATSFGELLEDFHDWRGAHPVAGIAATSPPDREPDLLLVDSDHLVRWWVESAGWVVGVTPLEDQLDFALVWGGVAPEPDTWAAPARRTGFEMRITAEGGRLLDRSGPSVVLRWFDEEDELGERAWFIPAEALRRIPVPASSDAVTLWSQPRFLID